MRYAAWRDTVINGVRQILTASDDVLFDEVAVYSNFRAGSGGVFRGYFVVPATDRMPEVFGATIAISSATGSKTCAVVTKVAGCIVQFRAAGGTVL